MPTVTGRAHVTWLDIRRDTSEDRRECRLLVPAHGCRLLLAARLVGSTDNPGLYLLADVFVYQEVPSSNRGLSLFVRVGFADGDVQQIAAYAGGGAVYTGPFPGRPADQIGLGVAAAHNGQPFKRVTEAAGERPAEGAVAVEATYRAELIP